MNLNQISTGGQEDMPKSTTTWARGGDSFFARQGWICPKCGRVYSPTTEMCLYCSNETNQITVIDKTFPDDWYIHHVDDPLKEPEIHLDKDWRNKEFFVDYESLPYYNVGV